MSNLNKQNPAVHGGSIKKLPLILLLLLCCARGWATGPKVPLANAVLQTDLNGSATNSLVNLNNVIALGNISATQFTLNGSPITSWPSGSGGSGPLDFSSNNFNIVITNHQAGPVTFSGTVFLATPIITNAALIGPNGATAWLKAAPVQSAASNILSFVSIPTVSSNFATTNFVGGSMISDESEGYCWDGLSNHYLSFHGGELLKLTNDASWNAGGWVTLVASNMTCMSGLAGVNHVGGIKYYNGNIYAVIETYTSPGVSSGQQIVRYNSTTLAFVDTHSIAASGQEASSLAIVPDAGLNGLIFVTSYNTAPAAEASQLSVFDLASFAFLGYVRLSSPIEYMQGIAYNPADGRLYIDGNNIAWGGDLHVVGLNGTNYGTIWTNPGGGSGPGQDIDIVSNTVHLLYDRDNTASGQVVYLALSNAPTLSVNTNGQITLPTIGSIATFIPPTIATIAFDGLRIGTTNSASHLMLHSGQDANGAWLGENATYKGLWQADDTNQMSAGFNWSENGNVLRLRMSPANWNNSSSIAWKDIKLIDSSTNSDFAFLSQLVSATNIIFTNLPGTALVSQISPTNLPSAVVTNNNASPVSLATNLFVAKTNFANYITLSNILNFINAGDQVQDVSGTLEFFNSSSGNFNFAFSSFGAGDGSLTAGKYTALSTPGFSGNGANLTSLNASQLTSGFVPIAALTNMMNWITNGASEGYVFQYHNGAIQWLNTNWMGASGGSGTLNFSSNNFNLIQGTNGFVELTGSANSGVTTSNLTVSGTVTGNGAGLTNLHSIQNIQFGWAGLTFTANTRYSPAMGYGALASSPADVYSNYWAGVTLWTNFTLDCSSPTMLVGSNFTTTLRTNAVPGGAMGNAPLTISWGNIAGQHALQDTTHFFWTTNAYVDIATVLAGSGSPTSVFLNCSVQAINYATNN